MFYFFIYFQSSSKRRSSEIIKKLILVGSKSSIINIELPGVLPSPLLALTLKKFLYFLKRKLFLYFGKQRPRKISYVLGNGTCLYFQTFLIFQERNIQNPGITELFLCSRKEIFKTLT